MDPNPKYLEGFDYEEDKVEPLEQIFARSTPEDGKKLVDAFIAFNKKLVALGVIDKSFNITQNFGLSKTGDVVLFDIGELLVKKSKIRRQLENRAWTKFYVVDHIKNEEVRNYFIEQMDMNFSTIQ